MTIKHRVAALAVVAGCAIASAASAAPLWPASITGTWNGTSNLSPIVLTVSSQSTGGKCQNITGSIEDANTGAVGNMLGYYCPGSGNVEFLRYPTNSNVAFQVYAGSLSQRPAPKGQILMGGVFGQYSPVYGPLGQYSFSLTN